MESESQDRRQGLRARGVERTRANILAAARRNLIDAGYRNLSLEQVAADAEITRVTIYRKFGNRLGLIDAVAENLSRQSGLVAGMRAAAALGDSVAAFTAMVSELCRFWSVDPDLFRRLIGLAAVDPDAREVVDSREQWRVDQVALFVARMAGAGRLRGPFDVDTAAAAVAAATSFTTWDELTSRLAVGEDEIEGIVLALLRGVVRLDEI